MLLKVPFFKQTTELNCGSAVLKMTLDYFGINQPLHVLEDSIGIKEGKGTNSIQIAKAAASFGLRTDFYSKHVGFNEDNLEHDFYKIYGTVKSQEESKRELEEAIKVGVNVQERTLSLDDLIGFVRGESIPIVLLDWNFIESKEGRGYQGHFVTVVGYDDDNIYVHNPSFTGSKEYMPIRRNLFNEARMASGTDEDVVIVHGK